MLTNVANLFILFFVLIDNYVSSKLFPIEYRLPLAGNLPALGSPWPKPFAINTTNQQFSLDPKQILFSSNLDQKSCEIIQEAIKRYKNIISIDGRYRPEPYHTIIQNVYIYIHDDHSCGYPHHDMNEEYWIEIPDPSHLYQIRLTSRSIWGALRALETLSQLIYANDQNQLLVNKTSIYDVPRYKYRGILLDSARHYLPKRIILANLDAMAMNKFNVFHWHLVDDQSFPFVSQRYPNISKYGAYTERHTYKNEDIQDIIEYARLRGIRVIPELDTPGHTHAMARAFPELLTPCYGDGIHPYTANYPLYSASEVLNPINNRTFEFMKELFEEFYKTFPDSYIHLGMDEVSYECWKSNPDILHFMKKNGWTDFHQLEEYYIKKTIQNVRNVGYKYLLYQDPVDNGVSLENDSIVIVWKDYSLDNKMDNWTNYIENVAKRGHKIILSACWYLNYISYPYPGMDWEKYYLCDPRNFNGSEDEKKLVIGGEACMWGEFVDATNLLSRLWPRASAVAERLWSKASETHNVDNARHRLDQHRCRMLRRGIPAAPILNGYCGDYEWDMANSGVKPLDGVIPNLVKIFN